MPVIYVNDNFGKWRSDFQQQVRHCLDDPVRGQRIACLLEPEALEPEAEDYFVLKPKHSAFYETPLSLMLTYLKVRTLILTGIAGDVCVLFTASDAFMRDYHLCVPADCVASLSPEDNARCLHQMHTTLQADIRASEELSLEAIVRQSREDSI